MTTHRSRVADYQIIDTESRASNGWFYVAEPPQRLGLDSDRVVLKVLDATGIAFERFTRELRAFAAVPSPYLVQLYDAGQQEDQLFYSMEWTAGGSLAAPSPPADRKMVTRAVAGAARAAHALHDAGIAHRDIQPRNVLLAPDRGKLRDLGLARIADPHTSTSTMPAEDAVEFVDPALIKGAHASRATDLYALGATLHNALTGRPLFNDLPSDPLAAVRHILRHEPVVDPALDDEIAAIIRRCIDPALDARFASALELAEALEAVS